MARQGVLAGALLIGGLFGPMAPFAQNSTGAQDSTGAALAEAEQPSRFEPLPLPASTFEPLALVSHFAEVTEQSSFGAIETPSSFGAVEAQSSFGAVEQPSTLVETAPISILTELGATQQGDVLLLTLPGDVLFDFDQSYIRDDARPVLARLAEALQALPDARVEITGHTDSKGSDDYNLALSQRRADAVRDWLALLGLSAVTMTTAGAGEASPVAPNTTAGGGDNPEGRQQNRRVEFVIRPG